MVVKRQYRTVLCTRPFMFQETRLVARRIRDGHRKSAIFDAVVEQNLFQLRSRDRRIRFFNEIWRRLDEADDFLLHVICTFEMNQGRLAVFFLILRVDDLFAEWMQDIWLDKYRRADFKLRAYDFKHFFNVKAEQTEQVANWSDETLQRLTWAYQSIMYQAGFVLHKGLPTEIVAPLLHPSVDEYFRHHEQKRLAAVIRGDVTRSYVE